MSDGMETALVLIGWHSKATPNDCNIYFSIFHGGNLPDQSTSYDETETVTKLSEKFVQFMTTYETFHIKQVPHILGKKRHRKVRSREMKSESAFFSRPSEQLLYKILAVSKRELGKHLSTTVS